MTNVTSMAGSHRNNAAEWVLWAVLLPAVPVVWLVERIARAAGFGSRL